MRDTKLYDLLGISPDADDKAIKKAYKKLSIKWHPDKNPNNKDDATKKFQEITEAYSVLSDPQKREMYHQVGIDILKNGAEGANVDTSSIFEEFMRGMGGGFNPFGDGGFNPFGGQPQRREKKLEDCVVEKIVNLEDIFNEKEVTVNYQQKNYCKQCNGNGTKDGKSPKCSDCNGRGSKVNVIRMGNMIQQMSGPCDRCRGSGESVSSSNKCSECNGKQFHIKAKSHTFKLKRGLHEGNKIQISDYGHKFKNGTTNLVILIKENIHPLFTRDGDNLIFKDSIELYQAIFGFRKQIKYLDGTNICLNIGPNKNINFGKHTFKAGNYGMYDMNDRRGDLYLEVDVKYPNINNLEKNELEILQKLLIKCNMDIYKKEISISKDIKNINMNSISKYQNNNKYQQRRPPQDNGPGDCVSQ